MIAKTDGGPLQPKDWERFFRAANIETDKLDAARSARAKATILGNFLARNVGREVGVVVNGLSAKAKLVVQECRANQRLYCFRVTPDVRGADEGSEEVSPAGRVEDSADAAGCTPRSSTLLLRGRGSETSDGGEPDSGTIEGNNREPRLKEGWVGGECDVRVPR